MPVNLFLRVKYINPREDRNMAMTLFEQLLLYIFPRTRFKSADRHIEIRDQIENGRAARVLLYDGIRESGMYLDKYGARDPLFNYMKTLKIILDHYPGLDNMLLIGGGGFVFPRLYLHGHPERKATVVEIDGGYVELARRFFDLDVNDKRLKIVIRDGQKFLRQQAENPAAKYSFIVYDAYIGDSPNQGILSEASMKYVKSILTDNGIYALNMINEVQDVISMPTRLAEAKLKQIFAHTRVVICPKGGNSILMASDRRL